MSTLKQFCDEVAQHYMINIYDKTPKCKVIQGTSTASYSFL